MSLSAEFKSQNNLLDIGLAVRGIGCLIGVMLASILTNFLLQQIPRSKAEPPLVFHWLPIIGNAVSYGRDPCNFFKQCQKKHGDIFTFILLGKRITVYLGTDGNDFVLNGKHQDLNAEEIYGPLTTPVFGSDVCYDCPNSKFIEQKKFIKFGLTQQALESHVQIIEKEVIDYVKCSPAFKGNAGVIDVATMMAQITIFTAGHALQGEEVRKKLTNEFAALYHDLDLGFRPINFLLPWAPLPQNRKRDVAHATMRSIYLDIIEKRRAQRVKPCEENTDMIWNLMSCKYKTGLPIPDKEIAHLMITLLMAGQHSSSSSGAWILLRLASRPDIADELYNEQIKTLGKDGILRPLEYTDIDKLPLLHNVIKETLRVHSSIHSLLRKVKRPIPVPGHNYVITPDKVLLASPAVTHLTEKYFPNALEWDPHRWDSRIEEADDIVDYGYGAVSKGTRSPYLPFGAGRHRCIGEKFAYVNLCTIISTLIRTFKFSTMDGSAWIPPTDYTSLFSRPVQPSIVRWQRRLAEKA